MGYLKIIYIIYIYNPLHNPCHLSCTYQGQYTILNDIISFLALLDFGGPESVKPFAWVFDVLGRQRAGNFIIPPKWFEESESNWKLYTS